MAELDYITVLLTVQERATGVQHILRLRYTEGTGVDEAVRQAVDTLHGSGFLLQTVEVFTVAPKRWRARTFVEQIQDGEGLVQL